MNSLTKILTSESEMLAFAEEFARVTQDKAVIFLSGPLGVGKTTFVRGFLRGFEYTDKVKSPTYSLIESYEIHDKTIIHVDLYRLQNEKELEEIGLCDEIALADICLIEWPDIGFALLPEPDLICHFAFTEGARIMQIKSNTSRGEIILSLLDGSFHARKKQ